MADVGSVGPLEDETMAEWYERNARRILIGVGTFAFVVLLAWWMRTSNARKEAFAAQSLEQARASAEAGNLPLAASDLSRVADRFRGTRSGDEAAVLLAQVRLLQGQTDAAVSSLQEFVAGRHPDYVKASAYNLLGAGLENKGDMRGAAEAYRQAAENATMDFLKAAYLMDAGRTAAASGDTAAAKAAYSRILTEFAELDQATEARVRMAEVGGIVPPAPRSTNRSRSGS